MVGDLDIGALERLYKAWRRSPPVSVLMRAYVGWKAPEESEAPEVSSEDRERMDKWVADRMNDLAQGKG